ncbi:methylated-DNA-protein-cysteine methyltransferase related protein YbaZ [Thermosynechococcus sp. NK55a]|jgi:methylated-DNA-protein-cysteine methyltransferase-like protein|uniref:MGMT family protein n=1 Tax=Thermosynechococcus sp. NK55a TaxID=1394889 RepID=UPI0003D8DAD3|nr:MGMT family protein [Thermosynechococcus sp. NK55a]AHB88896.1 methylated-DNA-protein-cysteine methyltransferase related protein YbaZ [Thermosynechococcus sp. NK55a]RMH67233.1 MAG: methyltransferase [Cyanobacteria bacterium J003]
MKMNIGALTFQQKIYWLVKQIPLGRVATYGQIAALCGWPRHGRYVGYALYRLAPNSDIPWHRVVNAQGKISYAPQRRGTDELQRWRLEVEGIVFEGGDRINLRRYQWQPPTMVYQPVYQPLIWSEGAATDSAKAG